MKKTLENLEKAFAVESQTNRKYLAFAKKAEKEGFKQIAKLFRAIADAETVHALSHLKIMGEVKNTEYNLKEAIAAETYEFESMYPKMIEQAKKDNNLLAIRTFEFANAVKKIHIQLFKKALKHLKSSISEIDYYVCAICGYTCEKNPPEKCPICNRQYFKRIKK